MHSAAAPTSTPRRSRPRFVFHPEQATARNKRAHSDFLPANSTWFLPVYFIGVTLYTALAAGARARTHTLLRRLHLRSPHFALHSLTTKRAAKQQRLAHSGRLPFSLCFCAACLASFFIRFMVHPAWAGVYFAAPRDCAPPSSLSATSTCAPRCRLFTLSAGTS